VAEYPAAQFAVKMAASDASRLVQGRNRRRNATGGAAGSASHRRSGIDWVVFAHQRLSPITFASRISGRHGAPEIGAKINSMAIFPRICRTPCTTEKHDRAPIAPLPGA
jgi:hypothetical protein